MRQVWGIGKRRFGKDWGKRLWIFVGNGLWRRDMRLEREGGYRKVTRE